MSKPHWRPAHASDLPAISAIAAQIHPALPESPEVLAEKMRLYPDGCRVLVAGDEIAGYGLAHPWKQYRIPPLDGLLARLPDDADCLYVHDVAVLPDFRGGVVRPYVADVEQLARASGIATLALVSVYATRPLWQRLGFRPVTADAALRAKLASYGEGSTYMLRDLTAV
ncbi:MULTISPECIES: GNAT family N-acetyltransferase [Bradyrhizobium]|uniref:GNAT family N-acetyltransferase n=1 Tax=Bradyrhizobium ottawaense TaxID=931866 RepID=A0A2U8PC20_9BRAD|nr:MULTISPECIES: GNAT family N-acetyltransferase [Bradyrhizobium]AWL95321.1 GNAT family N-acetyltransferase [Bradyrhizobium ottawaense]MBR1324952.1 GNAT family N-acetyltransferase [Bradyrhizobium ottawaense]MBR1333550.1 GNAT family N-acetyltransferase [Bradyrhizobium ottawaense]MBR1362673.1 GNAT family N-acetyltransferase [Bradyrhizobium ottawaense]MDA9451392.1 acetyltransferase [Bradyrhizobium sp. CCBAU 21360]